VKSSDRESSVEDMRLKMKLAPKVMPKCSSTSVTDKEGGGERERATEILIKRREREK
jgi:hypothetical protein